VSLHRVPLPPQLGPFVVGAKIGGGGMATVYLGRRGDETDPGLKLVALKVIKDELADEQQYLDMFKDEARILARFDHPSIIRHVDYGHTGSHRYIAMELVLGRSLMDAWEACSRAGKPMPIDLGAHVALSVAEALDYAHSLTDQAGKRLDVIHRDVNPTNIFLTYDGQVKLIDFGLAKATGRIHKSAQGVVKGKVPYLSPEQISENVIDQRTDIYALGATLWEMTTGRRLFKRETDKETIRAIHAHVIPDPSTIVDGWYPEALWRIVKKALEKDPENRYATAGAMADDLRAMLAKYGRKAPMKEALAGWIEELFPGEHAKQSQWLIEAAESARPRETMQPPAPIADIPDVLGVTSESIRLVPPAPAVVLDHPAPVAPAKPKASLGRALLAGLFLGTIVVAAYFALR
jgi:serine/threonine protein kinase